MDEKTAIGIAVTFVILVAVFVLGCAWAGAGYNPKWDQDNKKGDK